ncbi:histidine--tRNA ligase [Aspergillus fischeri NRRL 181]|uniref:Histidine--tRNA ligase, mitochondrial n=1 Tax=Neosartorya fischeri (strain ATCC 1020 / DSM 3700 / CBS 544.65 / FGSC A1164 / JCM 1740 / NRRL 181 / WB 181) TaxID=331117 RepID=A1CW52_NEOFI|nr:histidyl-tRNA synthetase, mitochondrial precursor [Aspergillus fischeri NRRL 181]EAW24854.1 histidyl-tRNA synthetase, mitochondrial precursor [Aspergillus fischeri NRRL 181]
MKFKFQSGFLRSARQAIVDPIVVVPVRRALPSAAAVRPTTLTLSSSDPTIPHYRHSSSLTLRSSRPVDTMPKDNKNSFNLKTPKGTKDWSGSDALLRDRIFSTIADVFKRHGGTALDTPVFELREILAGKYGEDSKLIYDLQDQGGEICSLRYDLTVPFARWLAMNPDVRSIKRYHIAKVYRRDQPAVSKGRMREFYQCDFDIAGAFDPMVPDAEILRIVTEVFEELGWQGRYTIKVNHRKILDGVFEVCGVPPEKIRPISSAVDKLDKMPWADVRKEMVEEKGLDGEVADRIEKYVAGKGARDLLESLWKDESLTANASAKAGLEEMGLLMDYLEAFGCLDKISFDMSLARGLDYYTGVIYEVVTEGSAPAVSSSAPEAQKLQKSGKKDKSKSGNLEDEDRSNDPTLGVGSVAAGGRYDNLVGMFLPKAQIPCVGVSFGVDRIFSITKARLEREKSAEALRSSEVDVFVMAFGGKGFTGMLKERMDVCQKLWNAGIKAEFSYKIKPKLPQQFKAAEQGGVPFAVILGEDELAAGQVRIKELGLEEGHPEKEGVLVDLAALTDEVKARLAKKQSQTSAKADISGVTQQLEAVKVEAPKTEDAGV